LTVAVRWKVIAWNPVTAVDPPSLSTAEVRPLSTAEARSFLATVVGDRFEARWRLAVTLGMRQGEVLGLSWEDVNVDQGTVQVRQSLQYRPRAGLVLSPPKTARARRTLPLSDELVGALRMRRERQASDRAAAGEFWEEWGLVFTTGVGTPVAPRNDYRDFRRLLEQAGLRRVRLHDLRHTAASLMLGGGVNPLVVMEVLGHSQISVTMNTYSHVSADVSRAAIEGVSSVLNESAGRA
jgi:integrase